MMANKIRIGIVGYGNLGRGAEMAVWKNPDMTLVGVFTRRDPSTVRTVNPDIDVFPYEDMKDFQDQIDVMILCGGSATDLPKMSPEIVEMYNIVDSYDNHAKIPDHLKRVEEPAVQNGKTGIVAVGWDPGLFSMNRLLGEIVLPEGSTYTFWGDGLSQGHSEAVRGVEGVKNAVQYTVPIKEVLEDARSGKGASSKAAQRHQRVCYVVAEDETERSRIEKEIKTMPDYFEDYDTTVHFISEEELEKNHSKMRHGGFVIRSGNTSSENHQAVEFSLTLESNPEFTASVLVAYARAAFKMNQKGETGAKTAFDVPFSYMTHRSVADVIKELL